MKLEALSASSTDTPSLVATSTPLTPVRPETVFGLPPAIEPTPLFVDVSPERATILLGCMRRNRRLSTRAVARYAKAMTEGRMVTTHQGLAFDRDGKLLAARALRRRLVPGRALAIRTTSGDWIGTVVACDLGVVTLLEETGTERVLPLHTIDAVARDDELTGQIGEGTRSPDDVLRALWRQP